MALDNIYADVYSTSYVSAPFDALGERYAPMLRALLPGGRAWKFEDDSDFYSLLRALSYSFYRAYLRGEDLLREFDPTTMVELIDDWERVLGLPGDNPVPPTTIAGRRAAIHAKMLGNADPTAAFFEELADGAGYPAIVKHKEFYPFVAGSVAGAPITNNTSGGWKYFWRVIVAPGDDDAMLQWVIESLVPLHTDVLVEFLGVEWVEQNNPKNVTLYDVVYANDRWVAVGSADGTDAYIITSEGVENCPGYMLWTERSNPKNYALRGLCFGAGLWVAVGLADGVDAYIVTSPDGITWTERSNPKNVHLFSVAYDGVGLFVAGGWSDGVDSMIITSSDGINWTERAAPGTNTIYSVAFRDGLWVATGLSSYILTSEDGITWTDRSTAKGIALYSVAYGDGLWVAVGGQDGVDAYIITSTDGVIWTERENPQDRTLYKVIYADEIKMFVAVGFAVGGDAYIVTSPDGITWTERANDKSINLCGIYHNNGVLVAVGYADGTDAYVIMSG